MRCFFGYTSKLCLELIDFINRRLIFIINVIPLPILDPLYQVLQPLMYLPAPLHIILCYLCIFGLLNPVCLG